MRIEILASGSSGNCYLLHGDNTKLMLDCGISLRGFAFNGLTACLITHEHSDHTKGLKRLLKASVPCYMSAGTAQKKKLEGVEIIEAGKLFEVGEFKVLPFQVYHDAAEPLGFLLKGCGKKILFATDTRELPYTFKGVTHILLECNYLRAILEQNFQAGRLHPKLRSRILKTHFELKSAEKFLLGCDLSQIEAIYLIHISRDNGDKQLFQKTIQAATGKPVFV